LFRSIHYEKDQGKHIFRQGDQKDQDGISEIMDVLHNRRITFGEIIDEKPNINPIGK